MPPPTAHCWDGVIMPHPRRLHSMPVAFRIANKAPPPPMTRTKGCERGTPCNAAHFEIAIWPLYRLSRPLATGLLRKVMVPVGRPVEKSRPQKGSRLLVFPRS